MKSYLASFSTIATTCDDVPAFIPENIFYRLSMNDAAKLLGIKGLGRNKLFEQLRSRGVLDESNVPYQRFLNSGHFEVIEKPYDYNGMVGITKVTRVTQKGLQWMSKEFSIVNH